MSDYFTYVPLTANTVARAADVNARFQAVEAGFALLPPPIYLSEDRLTFAEDEGVVNALIVNPDVPITAYNTGLHLTVLASNSNTGITTINVSGLGVKEIIRADGTSLQQGDIVDGQILDLHYDGSKFRLSMAYAELSPAGVAEKIALAGNIVVNGNLKATSITCNNVTLDALTAFGVSLVEATDQSAGRSALGLGTMATETATTYAPKASPALTGVPTAPTAAPGTNTTQLATTGFVTSAVATAGGSFYPLTGGILNGDLTRGQTIIKSTGISLGNGSYFAEITWPGAPGAFIAGPTSADDTLYFGSERYMWTNQAENVTFAILTASGLEVADAIYSSGWDGNLTVPTKNAVYDKIEANAVVVTNGLALKANLTGATFTGAVVVPDEVYGASWNGSVQVPTKNAVYDKIEAVVAGASAPSDAAYGAGWDASLLAPTQNAVYDKMQTMAPLASPGLTGTPTAPTAALATDSTQIATTAFVKNVKATVELVSAGTNTVTPTFGDDLVQRLAITAACTINAPNGTAVDGWGIVLRLRAAAVQTLSWNAIYRAIGVTLPTATVANKIIYVGMIYNSTDTKWDVLSVGVEA